MKGKKHTVEQVIRKLRSAETRLAEGAGIGEVCRELEVSEATDPGARNRREDDLPKRRSWTERSPERRLAC
jgi:hypothetical protein